MPQTRGALAPKGLHSVSASVFPSASPTELTTAATDVALALAFGIALARLRRFRVNAPWKRSVLSAVLALLAVASVIGAVMHGLAWSDTARLAFRHPVFVLLELSVMLFLVGAIHDWRGEATARRVLPWAVATGVSCYPLTMWLGSAFLIFVVFETAVMLAALAMYAAVSRTGRLAGAGLVTMGIGLTIVAGIVQTSRLSVHFFVPFDHNGLFHLIQLVAATMLAIGLRRGLAAS